MKFHDSIKRHIKVLDGIQKKLRIRDDYFEKGWAIRKKYPGVDNDERGYYIFDPRGILKDGPFRFLREAKEELIKLLAR